MPLDEAIKKRDAGVDGMPGILDWLRFARLHQWSKNLLVFVPLAIGHAYTDPFAAAACAAGFVALSLVASATYLVNDVLDAESDRLHPTKRLRLVAAGRVGKRSALAVSSVLGALGLVAAGLTGTSAVVFLIAYVLASLTYSLQVKRVPMLDVVWVGLLYTLRIAMGAELSGLPHSPWLLSFSAFFFVSLAMAKRHAEVHGAHRGDNPIKGRGYQASDWPVTLASGMAALCACLVVLVLYISEEATRVGLYAAPAFLWGCPVVIGAWGLRVWLLAHRGEIRGDPVTFALRDRPSLAHGLVTVLFFGAAVTGFWA